MNRVILSRAILRRTYVQDMPPPGGYPNVPWRRNIPTRGYGFIGVLTTLTVVYFMENIGRSRYNQWRKEMKLEAENQDMACMALFEAEQDRDELRALKHQIESEAVNIVASGFDKNWKCGGYGIGDNGNANYWPSNGFQSPYNLAIFKNSVNGDRFAKMYNPAFMSMSINNAMWTGAGKHEKVGPGTM